MRCHTKSDNLIQKSGNLRDDVIDRKLVANTSVLRGHSRLTIHNSVLLFVALAFHIPSLSYLVSTIGSLKYYCCVNEIYSF